MSLNLSDNNVSDDYNSNIEEEQKSKDSELIYSNISPRNRFIIHDFKQVVNVVYDEACKAIAIFDLNKDIYGFHNAMHNILNMLYKFEIFVFKGLSILVYSSIDTRFEKDLSYFIECVHSKHSCNLLYFFSKEVQNRICENLKYIRDFKCLELLEELKKEYEKENILKQYIFDIVKKQFYYLFFCYKYDESVFENLFNNRLKVVGVASDIYNLSQYFGKELVSLVDEKTTNDFERLKSLLKNLIEYKIQLLSDNEICLMLKIYCIVHDENMPMLDYKKCSEIFYELINIFIHNKRLLYKSDNIKFFYFREICANKEDGVRHIFLTKVLKDQISNLNDLELDYLRGMLKYEVYSDSSNKHYYSSISRFGSYISDCINKEIYEFLPSA